jgi:hypothetical protein
VAIALRPPVELLHLWRVDPQHRQAPGLPALNQRAPRDSRRFQGHGREPAGRQPVGSGFPVDGRRATAAHRLRSITGRPGDIMGVGAHVDTRCVPVNGGQLGWQSRLGAPLWRLTVDHRGLHAPRRDRQGQGGRERRRCRTLPHGIRAAPVTTAVATGARDHPHTRAHRTMVPTASHGPLPWRASIAGGAPVPSRCTAAQRHKHPHKA